MAEISLRAYVNEIDNLIERDQLDEAIAHSRHILEIYPKHLETYRLLGKSYLEAKRFGDAADIFQRVLSSVPDDFVSHIGMAIVREDEGNLDSAIWHMERAYETNPSNPAIRQELSRLIGRRDGLEPNKIRLTRGALARQYAHGELYPQAIAELQSALHEDPDRPDLHALLALMYWRSAENEQAKESSKRILEKLPFCLEANRIMAAVLQEEDNVAEATEYHRRLAALDPYASFVESAAVDPKSVDANSVRIERLDWRPGQPLPNVEPDQPEWVASLGVDLSAESAETEVSSDSPSWLEGVESTPSIGVGATPALVGAAATNEMTENSNAEDNQIPEWMREAGWESSSGEVEEGPVSFSDEEIEALESGTTPPPESEGDLEPAEIPSWLQDIAPSEEEAAAAAPPPPPVETPAATAGQGSGVPAWLSDITSDAEDVPPDPTEPGLGEPEPSLPEPEFEQEPVQEFEAEPTPEIGTSEVPTWVEDEAPGATSTIITWLGDMTSDDSGDTLPGQTPDWLSETTPLEDESAAEEPPSMMEETPEEEPEIAAPDAHADQGAPSWLAGVAAAASQPEPPAEYEAEAEVEAEAAAVEPTDFKFPLDREPSEETPAWLSGISASDLQATAKSPEWLDELRTAGGDVEPSVEEGEAPSWTSEMPSREPPSEEEIAAEADEPAPVPAEVPEWLQGIGEESGIEIPPREREVPDWLSGIAEPEPAVSLPAEDEEWLGSLEEEVAEVEESPQDSGMDFDMDALRAAAVSDAVAEVGEEVEAAATADVGIADELDDDEVFDWLEKLAEDQEAEAPSGVRPIEERPEVSTVQSAPEQLVSDLAPPDEPEASMEWLEELASQRSVEAEIAGTPPVEMPPFEPGIEAPVSEELVVEIPAAEEPASAPDWLREMASTPTDETAAPEVPITPSAPEVPPAPEFAEPELPEEEPEIPDWLMEPVEAPSASAPTRPAPTSPIVEEVVKEPSPIPTEERVVTAPEPIEVPPSPEEIPTPAAEVADFEPGAPVAPPVSPEPEAPVVEPTSPKYKEPPTDVSQLLQEARQALAAGDAGRALSNYRKLIDKKKDIDTVISDLEHASERYPNLPTMWQALGDAYMRADRLPEAIKAYQRGMEVA